KRHGPMGTQTLFRGKQERSGEAKLTFGSFWPEVTHAARADPGVNVLTQRTRQRAVLTPGGVRPIRRRIVWGDPKQHTECFMCSRIFFDMFLEQCPRCGSRSLRQYTSGEFNTFARPADVSMHVAHEEGRCWEEAGSHASPLPSVGFGDRRQKDQPVAGKPRSCMSEFVQEAESGRANPAS